MNATVHNPPPLALRLSCWRRSWRFWILPSLPSLCRTLQAAFRLLPAKPLRGLDELSGSECGFLLPSSSWFSLRFGRKNFLLICVVIFTVSSFLCGAATSLGWILIARSIQGAGGGAWQPISQAILLESFPPEKRASAMAVFASASWLHPSLAQPSVDGSRINTPGAGLSTSTCPWESWRF
jgi:MFS family permease